MFIEDPTGVLIEVRVRDYKPNLAIGYELVQGTSKQFFAVDRGVQTDEYTSDITLRGTYSEIESYILLFNGLRDSNKDVIITAPEVPLFGDHISYANPLVCSVVEISVQETADINVMALNVTLMLQDAVLGIVSDMPSLRASYSNWTGGNEWEFDLNITNSGVHYNTRYGDDAYIFNARYMLDKDTTNYFYSFWTQGVRGKSFSTTSDKWGVSKMFGATLGDNHKVIIKSIDTEIISPIFRNVSVEVIRQGDDNGRKF
jgi:hypothetical protein